MSEQQQSPPRVAWIVRDVNTGEIVARYDDGTSFENVTRARARRQQANTEGRECELIGERLSE